MSFFNGDIKSDEIQTTSSIKIKEISSAPSDTAAFGQLWVKTATPNELYFTTDAGDDIQITSGTSLAGGGGGGAVSSVTNGSDNRIATFSSSDALNGEANLTFDGSHLSLSGGISFPKLSITTDSADNQTYTATEMIGGIIIRTSTSFLSDTTDTAANIVNAIPNAVIGSSFRFIVVNKTASTITLNKGTGITFENGATIEPSTFSIELGNIFEFLVYCTNVTSSSEAVTLFRINKQT